MDELGRTLEHLRMHHVDFGAFMQAMEVSHAGRFDPIFWAFLERNLPSAPQCILDAGAGPGLFALDLKARFPSAQVVALEVQPEMLKAARRRFEGRENLVLVEADVGQRWPASVLLAGQPDLVVASMLLHELQVPYRALVQASGVLRLGGRFIIYDWVRQPLCSYLGGELPDSEYKVTHFSEHCRYEPADYIWMCEKVGLKCLDWMLVHSGKHMLAVFEKINEDATGDFLNETNSPKA
jgi:SAM-dependent methyltransferase